jgi:rod shape-determining protein MreD
VSVVERREAVRGREQRVAAGRRHVLYPVAAAIALIAAIYLQVALAVDARLGAATPDLIVVVILVIALRWGPVGGALAGFAAGVVLDLAVVQPIGGSALILVVVGWLMGYLARRGPEASALTALGVLVVGVLVRGALELGGAAIIGTPSIDPVTQAGVAVVGAFLTLLVALPVVLVVFRRRRLEPELTFPVVADLDDVTAELEASPSKGTG